MSIKSAFMAGMLRRRPVLTLTNAGGEPYSLKGYLDSCFIKNGSDTVGYVQGLSTNGNTLKIDHFAVAPDKRNGISADDMIKAFAHLVRAELLNINVIAFDLGRATSGSDIQTLANARVALLTRIQAVNIVQKQVNKTCIVVSGAWHQANW